MAAFYFHECYPAKIDEAQLKKLFSNWVKEYDDLVENHKDNIDKGIVTTESPENIILGGHNLAKIIRELSDRDVRRKAFGFFTRNPIDNYTDDQLLTEDIVNDAMICLGHEEKGTMLYYAYLNGYWATSLPLSSEYITGSLEIFQGETKLADIFNWSGTLQTALCEEKLKDPNRSFLDCLPDYLSRCKISEEFEEQFSRLSSRLQTVIFKRILLLNQKKKFTPTVVVDKENIKKCKGTVSINVYEIRLLNINYRVYFSHVQGTLYFGSVLLKSNHQSTDICHAEDIINQMIEKDIST